MKDLGLLGTIREAFGRVVYTHRTHEVMITQICEKAERLNNLEIALIAISASGITTSIAIDQTWIKIASAILAFLSLAISLYKINLSSETRMLSHRITANKLWLIREEYINLISDFSEERLNTESAAKKRDELQLRLKEIYDSAPQTSNEAYKIAQERLQKMEDFTFSDEEINKFLPAPLHFKKE